METWQILFGSGVAVVAIINLIKELILWRKNRNAAQEDAKDENASEIRKLSDKLGEYIESDKERAEKLDASITSLREDVEAIKTKQDAQTYALQISLQNTILYRGSEALQNGSVSVDEYARLQKLAEGAKAVGADGIVSAMMNKLEGMIGL